MAWCCAGVLASAVGMSTGWRHCCIKAWVLRAAGKQSGHAYELVAGEGGGTCRMLGTYRTAHAAPLQLDAGLAA